MNWFVFTCGMLQLGGGIHWMIDGNWKFGIMMIMYGITNFWICVMSYK